MPKIIAEVHCQMAIESVEVESDSEDEDGEVEVSNQEMIRLCQQLEGLCIKHSDENSSLALSHQLQHFRVHLSQQELMQGRLPYIN